MSGPDSTATNSPSEGSTRTKSRKRYNQVMKIVRRVHMYTGLILLPWVILFGFSGMMFNHPEFGPVKVLASKSRAQMEKTTGFAPLDAEALISEVIAGINASAGSSPDAPAYTLAKGSPLTMSGTMTFSTTTDEGRASVIMSPSTGKASVRRFQESASQENPPFHNQKVALQGFEAHAVETQAEQLLKDTGLEPTSPLEASSRGGTELRFQVVSTADDRKWNVNYSLGSGTVTARATDAPFSMNFYTAVTRLHKTHHYPDTMGARWLWTFLADATGLTMVFWGISGLIMWWQIKPTRVVGVSALSVAVVIAVTIFSGTLHQMTFGPTQSRGGGGGGGGRSTEQRGESSSRGKTGAPAPPGKVERQNPPSS